MGRPGRKTRSVVPKKYTKGQPLTKSKRKAQRQELSSKKETKQQQSPKRQKKTIKETAEPYVQSQALVVLVERGWCSDMLGTLCCVAQVLWPVIRTQVPTIQLPTQLNKSIEDHVTLRRALFYKHLLGHETLQLPARFEIDWRATSPLLRQILGVVSLPQAPRGFQNKWSHLSLLRENVPFVTRFCRNVELCYHSGDEDTLGKWGIGDGSSDIIDEVTALAELEELICPAVDHNGSLPFVLSPNLPQTLVALVPTLLQKGLFCCFLLAMKAAPNYDLVPVQHLIVRCANQVYLQSRRDYLVPRALQVSEFLHSPPSQRLQAWEGTDVLDLLYGLFRGYDSAGPYTNLPSRQRYDRQIQAWLKVPFALPETNVFKRRSGGAAAICPASWYDAFCLRFKTTALKEKQGFASFHSLERWEKDLWPELQRRILTRSLNLQHVLAFFRLVHDKRKSKMLLAKSGQDIERRVFEALALIESFLDGESDRRLLVQLQGLVGLLLPYVRQPATVSHLLRIQTTDKEQVDEAVRLARHRLLLQGLDKLPILFELEPCLGFPSPLPLRETHEADKFPAEIPHNLRMALCYGELTMAELVSLFRSRDDSHYRVAPNDDSDSDSDD